MNSANTHTLLEVATHCDAELCGDGGILISGIASIASARVGDLVFAGDEQKLEQALRSEAAAVIVGEFAREMSASKALLIVKDPRLAFARAATLFRQEERREGCDESAQVHLSAQIGEHVWIGPGVVIEDNARIGDRSSIGANTVVSAGVRIGEECRIGPNVTIYSGCDLGNRVRVQAGTVLGSAGFGYVRDEQGRYSLFPQIGRLVIEDDVEIGANCTVDRGALDATVIRRGVKLDNLVHVGHNVEIAEDVVIAAQTGVSGSSQIGKGAIVGGQVGIADGVEIGEGAILGAQSGIPSGKKIRGKGIVFWGTPARPIKDYLRELATLARLSRKKEK
jgi:UDP-3-O-[3-hydroxymyristoyl] glucosamine N-acyltransferase